LHHLDGRTGIVLSNYWNKVALVDVLQEHLVESPGSSILTKWVEDFAKAASFQYISAGIPVNQIIVCSMSVKSRKFA
jgi:hypothetical protein